MYKADSVTAIVYKTAYICQCYSLQGGSVTSVVCKTGLSLLYSTRPILSLLHIVYKAVYICHCYSLQGGSVTSVVYKSGNVTAVFCKAGLSLL